MYLDTGFFPSFTVQVIVFAPAQHACGLYVTEVGVPKYFPQNPFQ